MSQAGTQTQTRTKPSVDVKEPPMFRVIYINDDQTSMEFVVGTLVDYFDYTVERAHELAVSIHESGSAVVAILPYEIAEQKGIEITIKARAEGFPLQIKLEPSNL
jgi:ATP-dependent Clp protease adaptor protein ClpS